MLPWAIFSTFKKETQPKYRPPKASPFISLEPHLIQGVLGYLSGSDVINLLLATRSLSQLIVKELYSMPKFNSALSFFKFLQTIQGRQLLYPYAKYVKRLYLDEMVSNDLLIGDLQLVLELLPYLQEFSLIGCPQGSNLLISMLSKYTPCLTYLRLQGTTVTDSLIGIVCSQLVELAHLNLESSSISLTSLKTILVNAVKLSHLNLSYSRSSSDPWGKPIYSNLSSLILKHSEISDDGLSWISASCPLLNQLNLDGCLRFSDNGIYAISRHCKSLETLSVNFCLGITDISLQALSIHSCKSLKILKCQGCDITSKGIEMLNDSCKLNCLVYRH